MSDSVEATVVVFVKLVLKHRGWRNDASLTPLESRVLVSALEEAGFKPGGILILDAKEARSEGCRLVVVDHHNVRDQIATGWMRSIFILILDSQDFESVSSDQLRDRIMKEVLRSQPMVSIVLTKERDQLLEFPPKRRTAWGIDYLVDHTRDDDPLEGCVGVHDVCGGYIHRLKSSEGYDILLCRKCALRIPFVNSVQTYGELRMVMTARLSSLL